MIIGIISDTHDNAANLLKAVEAFNKNNVELVIHCGDWVSPFMPGFCKELNCKIISVFGNNEGDIFRLLNKNNKIEFDNKIVELEFDNKKIIVYHGDSKPLLNSLVDSENYDVVFSGHTHVPFIKNKGKTLHVNPGSTCGVVESKLTDKKTIAIYDTKTNKAEIVNIE